MVSFLAAAVVLAVTASPAWASTFTVNSTADLPDLRLDGTCDANATVFVSCTLRAAIQEANAPQNPGPDTIGFNIPSNGGNCSASTLCTISPASTLPAITEAVTIDGYSQGNATPNTETAPGVTNAVLRIELEGSAAPANTQGLTVRQGPTTIRGLVINEFSGSGIAMLNIAGNTSNVVEGNFLGTDPTGLVDEGNGVDGVQCFGQCASSRIGGPLPAARNLASGNGRNGIFINSDDNTVESNLVGTNRNGTSSPNDLGNGEEGIIIDQNGNLVRRNTVAFNSLSGIAVGSTFSSTNTGNRLDANSLFSNDGLGIDLNVGGVNPNDTRDTDDGANRKQNYPELFSAPTTSGTTTISGRLSSRPNKTFTIQFFSGPAADPSGNGEGKTFLGQRKVGTNRKGRRAFTFTAVLPPGEQVVTATAINDATGDTSEFSDAIDAF